MRSTIVLLILAVLSLAAPAAHSETRMDIGASIVNGDVRGFYFALGEYFRVPEREIVVIRDRHIPDYDVPVVLYIAQRARVAPGAVIDLRLSGMSWMDITLHFGLGPDIYYVPVKQVYGPPYGNAYGHFKHKPRKQWRSIRLADDEVVNLVNLRFISERYGHPPEEVMRLRSGGRSFVDINDEIRRGKKDMEFRQQDRGERREYREERGGMEKSPGREGKGNWKEKGVDHPGKGHGRSRDDN